jgi:hypothetical protein
LGTGCIAAGLAEAPRRFADGFDENRLRANILVSELG